MTDRQMIKGIRLSLKNRSIDKKDRSAWDKGVTVYALELLDGLEEAVKSGYFEDMHSPKLVRKELLNGAENWNQYSWGGCSLIYDSDIAERLCTPSELKKTKHGENRPNSSEEWLDVQARALYQASAKIMSIVESLL